MPAIGLKIVGMEACLHEDIWAPRLWVSGVLVLEFGPILAWYRFPAAEEFVVIFDIFFA